MTRPARQPRVEVARQALYAAHEACRRANDDVGDVIGLSHGPFSGVNVALGMLATLEAENTKLRLENEALRQRLAGEAA